MHIEVKIRFRSGEMVQIKQRERDEKRAYTRSMGNFYLFSILCRGINSKGRKMFLE